MLCNAVRFQVYDADTSAPARYLLTSRMAPGSDKSANTTTPMPGHPLRWELSEDLSGMIGMARMSLRAQQMYTTYVSAVP